MTAKKDQEVKVRTYALNEDVIIPADETLVSIEHDRLMGVTRTVTTRDHDPERTAKEREETLATDQVATVYPQAPGPVASLVEE